MKIKITNTAFVEANAAMKPLVGKDSTGLFSNVRLDSTGHAVSLTGTNGDIQLEWRIKEEAIESADAGVATVSGARLAAFASAMPSGIVTVEDVAEDKIKVEGAGVTFRLATGDAAGTAILYGVVLQTAAYLLQFTEDHFAHVRRRDGDMTVEADYLAPRPSAEIDLRLSVRLFRAIEIGFGMLRAYLTERRRARRRAAKRVAAKKADRPANIV